jgi:hypothetical protein
LFPVQTSVYIDSSSFAVRFDFIPSSLSAIGQTFFVSTFVEEKKKKCPRFFYS